MTTILLNEIAGELGIIVIIGIIIIAVSREIICWFWKINRRIEIQEQLLERLKEILVELKRNNKSL